MKANSERGTRNAEVGKRVAVVIALFLVSLIAAPFCALIDGVCAGAVAAWRVVVDVFDYWCDDLPRILKGGRR